MSQNVLLRAKGIFSFSNILSEVPNGALAKADNLVINRDGIIESRRGNAIYGNAMGILPANRAKQKLRYKGRVLRHYLTKLEFDNGSGVWTAFNGDYLETDTGLRIKGLEANGNFYFTTDEGIKKIAAKTANDLTSAVGLITDAGGIKAIGIEGTVDYTNPGFFVEESKVAYRVVWGIRDANNNLVLGSPSSRLVLTNPSTTQSGNVQLTINIPDGITENHFYQVYRTAVLEAGAVPLDEIDPGDEMYLVIEDFPTAAEIISDVVSVLDITPEDFRAGGAFLYTNPISGEGILQANEPPPFAKDIALFKGTTYYANTETRHSQTISLLSVSDFVSGTSKFAISNGITTNVYTFVGEAESTEFTFDSAANTTQSSYFILYSASDARKYVVWFNKDAGGTEPSAPDTTNSIFIEVAVTTGDTDAQVRAAVKIALDAADIGDFTYIESSADLTVTCVLNGNVTNAVAGSVPPGGAFAIVVLNEGDGEDPITKDVLLSNAASVAQAIDETANSLVRIINKQSSETVSAFYLSGPEDIPGQILLQNKDLSDVPFYVAVSPLAIVDKWNPTLPLFHTITANSAANPTVITSVGHGLSTGEEIVIGGSNSTPSIDGIKIVTVLTADTFSIPVPVTVAGTSGIFYYTSVASDNEEAPNRIYYSKYQQAEAVPIVNFIDVGPRDQAILRILALRDSLFILKTDGIYRLTGEAGVIPTVTLMDSSSLLTAPDSAAILNNNIYMLSTQGVVRVSDTGVEIISRPIENLILETSTVAYTNFSTAAWGIGYESDRCYLLFLVSEQDDEVATQCFRFNTFTSAWTRWPISKTCGVIGGDDRLYFGAGDTNFSERERKDFNRKDFADRELISSLQSNSILEDGRVIQLISVANVDVGDAIVQTQYVTISTFNRLLRKLDIDQSLDDDDYFDELQLISGGNLTLSLEDLVIKLNIDDASRHTEGFDSSDVNTGTDTITINNHGFVNDDIVYFSSDGTLPAGLVAETVYYIRAATTNTFEVSLTRGGTAVDITTGGTGNHEVTNDYFFSNSTVPSEIQTEFNIIIDQLNNSEGVFFSNYRQSEGTSEQEVIVTQVNTALSRITVNYLPAWVQGDLSIFKGIPCSLQWVPQVMQDPSVLKQVREATQIFENTAFYSAVASYRSDLSRSFEFIPFFGMGAGTWGGFPWGEVLWGGNGATTPLRTLIPQQKQRCRYIDCAFDHINAREEFALYGLSLTYEVSSSRAYR